MSKRKNILVVDDDQGIRSLLSIILISEGYGVTEAANGKQALKKADNESIDMMTLDLGLPDMDGLDVLERIKRDRPDLPVAIVSVRNDHTTIKKAQALGAEHYITKPFESYELLEAVEEAVG